MSPLEYGALLPQLLIWSSFGEELLFRGWMQTSLTRSHGRTIGIALPALCFGLRHLPMDLHYGLAAGATTAGWASRLVQLYGCALVLGLARHLGRSTWSSFIAHEGLLCLVALSALGQVAHGQ